jgi:hypothetical protein
MRTKARLAGIVSAMALVMAVLAVPSMASAHTGEFSKFNYCPSTNKEVLKCLYSVTAGGEVVLGNKKVPIVNPVVLQGGYGAANEKTFLSPFFGATNGETLSKTPQPVPGGLTGLVNCKEIGNVILRVLCEATFENGFTGVNSTLELARPASEIKIGEFNLLFREESALVLPVKVHLENPLLGSGCYIGSSANPIWWNLTTGTTAPPAPNKPISGSSGTSTEIEKEQILKFTGVKLVDNAWSAPSASGCGGSLWELLLDPIINASVGVPSAAGHNTANQEKVTLYTSPVEFVNAH